MSKLRRPQRYVWGHNARLQKRVECVVVTCHDLAHSAGYCVRHLTRVKAYGTIHPVTARLDPMRYFWTQVSVPETPDGCWIWTGPTTALGYGRAQFCRNLTPAKSEMAHRVAYEIYNGPLPLTDDPRNLPLDHLCRNHPCVNPEHLEPVTVGENTRRGLHGVMRTHCKNGHELTDANTYLRAVDNSRCCRRCRADETAEKRRRGESAERQLRTHCPNGHELTPENTKMNGLLRACRTCARRSAREYARRQRAALRTELNLTAAGVD
jgi:hypothetical protein